MLSSELDWKSPTNCCAEALNAGEVAAGADLLVPADERLAAPRLLDPALARELITAIAVITPTAEKTMFRARCRLPGGPVGALWPGWCGGWAAEGVCHSGFSLGGGNWGVVTLRSYGEAALRRPCRSLSARRTMPLAS